MKQDIARSYFGHTAGGGVASAVILTFLGVDQVGALTRKTDA
ncbi:MAG: hypothetical protein WA117_08470 [Verrucomicrobiia bacterium]